MDFVSLTKSGGLIIHETKGTLDQSSTHNSVIKQGKVKLNQLAQLVFYMIRKKTNKGKLVCGAYRLLPSGLLEQTALREFKIEFNEAGQILVDKVPFQYTIEDQLNHQLTTAEVLKTETIWDRPEGFDSKWASPCKFCDYSDVCTKWDAGELTSKEEILEYEKTEAIKPKNKSEE